MRKHSPLYLIHLVVLFQKFLSICSPHLYIVELSFLLVIRTMIYCVGLDLLPGSKRKYPVDARHWIELNRQENSVTSSHLVKLKRAKQDHLATRFGLNESNWDVSMSGGAADFHASAHKHNSLDCAHASACAIEDSLSKGFEGYLSIGSFQYEAYHADMHIPGSLSCVPTSACAIEDSLSKGFEGYLSIGSPFQYDQKHGVS